MFSLKVQTRVGQVSSRRIAARRSPRTAKSADYGEEKKKYSKEKKKKTCLFGFPAPKRGHGRRPVGEARLGGRTRHPQSHGAEGEAAWGAAARPSRGAGAAPAGPRGGGSPEASASILCSWWHSWGRMGQEVAKSLPKGSRATRRKPVGGHRDLESLLRLWGGSCSPSRTDEAFCPDPAAPTSVQHLHGAAFLHLHHLQSRSGTVTPAPRAHGGRCPPPLPEGTGAAGPPEALLLLLLHPTAPGQTGATTTLPLCPLQAVGVPQKVFSWSLLLALGSQLQPNSGTPLPASASHRCSLLLPTPRQCFEGHQRGPNGHRTHAQGGFHHASSDRRHPCDVHGQRSPPGARWQRGQRCHPRPPLRAPSAPRDVRRGHGPLPLRKPPPVNFNRKGNGGERQEEPGDSFTRHLITYFNPGRLAAPLALIFYQWISCLAARRRGGTSATPDPRPWGQTLAHGADHVPGSHPHAGLVPAVGQ